MRLLLATTLALASAITASAQAPTRIRDVAKFIEIRTFRGESYPRFNYQGVWVSGDVSLQDYNDATGIVRRELHEGEVIIEVVASQQVPLERQDGKDLIVRTCERRCGGSVKSHAGRSFTFERVAGKLQVSATYSWIE